LVVFAVTGKQQQSSCQAPVNDRLDGTTLDLSLGGALVQSHRAFPTGTPVTANLDF
jgi:hypothetical protein